MMMSVTDIGREVSHERMSNLQAYRKLRKLGYTFQECRRIVVGGHRARMLRLGMDLPDPLPFGNS